MNKVLLSASLLLCAGFCLAKKTAADAGPFQWGRVLEPLATLSMKTAEISAYMPSNDFRRLLSDDYCKLWRSGGCGEHDKLWPFSKSWSRSDL